MSDFIAPTELARTIAGLPRPLLAVFDCDGVLAPLTDHADDSVLHPGVGDALDRLARFDDIDVAILSGRSLDGLAQFEFAASIHVCGSYGAERRGHDRPGLSAEESERLRRLDELASDAASRAGDGAWVERKPTSVVVHVREAEPRAGRAALDWVLERQAQLDGHTCHEGNNVVELMTRSADKGSGMDDLKREFRPASCVYAGDDLPDEDAFAQLTAGDVGIKVGPGESRASHRLADADAVRSLLDRLVAEVEATPQNNDT